MAQDEPPQMSEGPQVRGGASGLTATFDDMRTWARMVDVSADAVREAGLSTAKLLLSADLAQAAVICPAEVGQVEAALAGAATGPSGAVELSLELEVLARLVRSSVSAYELADARLAGLVEEGLDVAGFAVGAAAVPLALGGVAALGVANPLLLAELGATGYLDRGRLLGGLQQTMYDDPWLEEALTRMAPGLVQGGAFSTLGPFWSVTLSGREWPTTDFSSAMTGLITFGGTFGVFQDTGSFRVARVAHGTHPVDLGGGTFVGSIFREQAALGDSPGQVQIITVQHRDGPSYVVQIPGTQVWSPVRGDSPVDLTTNLALEAMRPTRMERAVSDAMARAHIPPGAPVMLTGHSQGGIVAASLTTDRAFMARYHVTSVVTGGSPIARVPVPDDVSVLSLEHEQDIVDKLEGRDNPERPNWVTVTRKLSDAEGTENGVRDLVAAHSALTYSSTGHDVDVSTSETIRRWRQQNAAFFSDGPEVATAVRYQISRE